MVSFEEIHTQNHRLIESSNVLMYLLKERSMCDTEIGCNLLFSFMDNLNHHLGSIDGLYPDLLNDKSSSTNNTARMFMSGEQELKRIIHKFTKKWCVKNRQQLKIIDHDQFVGETIELFELVLTRIQNETEHLYPLVKLTSDKREQAA